jgi:hypothetical protein
MPFGPRRRRLLAVIGPARGPLRLALRLVADGALWQALDADEAGRTLTADDSFEAHASFSLNSGASERLSPPQAIFAARPG